MDISRYDINRIRERIEAVEACCKRDGTAFKTSTAEALRSVDVLRALAALPVEQRQAVAEYEPGSRPSQQLVEAVKLMVNMGLYYQDLRQIHQAGRGK